MLLSVGREHSRDSLYPTGSLWKDASQTDLAIYITLYPSLQPHCFPLNRGETGLPDPSLLSNQTPPARGEMAGPPSHPPSESGANNGESLLFHPARTDQIYICNPVVYSRVSRAADSDQHRWHPHRRTLVRGAQSPGDNSTIFYIATHAPEILKIYPVQSILQIPVNYDPLKRCCRRRRNYIKPTVLRVVLLAYILLHTIKHIVQPSSSTSSSFNFNPRCVPTFHFKGCPQMLTFQRWTPNITA